MTFPVLKYEIGSSSDGSYNSSSGSYNDIILRKQPNLLRLLLKKKFTKEKKGSKQLNKDFVYSIKNIPLNIFTLLNILIPLSIFILLTSILTLLSVLTLLSIFTPLSVFVPLIIFILLSVFTL